MSTSKSAQAYFEEFHRLKEQPVRQRAKGISFHRVGWWTINAFWISIIVNAPWLIFLRRRSYALFLLAAYVVGWFVFGLPEHFYHQEKRRKRYLRKHYPAVYRAIASLRQPGETVLYNIPPLHIDGRLYFLVSYFIRQPWWQIKPWVRLRGWIVFDEQGRVVQDMMVFAKAFITMGYANIGAVEVQKRQEEELIELRFALRKYLPRAEKMFRKRERFFEEHGAMYQREYILQRFPLFYEAVRDAMQFYDVVAQFRKAMGYSFGYEFWYEEGVHAERVHRAFGEYMRLTYKEEITNALLRLEEIWKELPRRKSLTKYILDMFWRTLKQVWDLINYTLNTGIPTVLEWQVYVARVELAKQKGLPIVGKSALPDGYPFKGALYHDAPWRER